MEKNNKKILIATGGTGGHIFPSLSLVSFLKENYEIGIITDARGLKFIRNDKKINVKIMNFSTIFNKNFFKTLISFIKIIFSIFFSFFFILAQRPKIVIGMGGYSSFPVCVAAFCLRIPLLIYENNLVIGRANKFLLPICKKIIVSTKNTKGIKTKYSSKVFFSGFLIRDNILNLKKQQIINSDKNNLSILIMGGSQSVKLLEKYCQT